MNRIYLDNAATSFPKPVAVYDAANRYQRELGVAVGRGATQAALDVQKVVDRCRENIAKLMDEKDSRRIIFTSNGTESLNLVLFGLLKRGDHVVTSMLEHNSVLRPLNHLERKRGIRVTRVEPDPSGRVNPIAFRDAICPETKLFVLIHASNVTGILQPIENVGEIARSHHIPFLVDAAQSLGHLEISTRNQPFDLLAAPGHKGLLGPLGTGILWIRSGLEEQLDPFRMGGTGTQSEENRQPETLPEKYESGNHNAPGIFGLDAGVEFLMKQKVDQIRTDEQELLGNLIEGLADCPSVTIHGDVPLSERVGLISLSVANWNPQIFATLLDESFRIESRAGFHCAPGAHQALGTLNTGGTVRLSLGPFVTTADIEQTIIAIQELTR